MRVIAVINQKGGCGKTTSAINLAGVFAKRGLRTLLVDMDPQSHCAAGLAIPEQRMDLDIGDAMVAADPARVDPSRLLWRVSRNLDLAPSRMRLAGLEAPRGGLADKPDKEHRLARVLGALAHTHDVCCIDCSPAIGLLAFNAITAASEILIPVETSYFSLQGAMKQVNTVRAIEKRLGVKAPCWLLATMHDETSALALDLLGELRRRFATRVAPVVIRYDSALKEAASFGQPVVEYAPASKGAMDYSALAEWLVEQGGPGGAGPDGDEPAAEFGGMESDARPSMPPEPRSGLEAKPMPVPTASPSPDLGMTPSPAAEHPSVESIRLAVGGARSWRTAWGDEPAASALSGSWSGLKGEPSRVEVRPHVAAGLPPPRAPTSRPIPPFGEGRFGVRVTDEGVRFSQPASLGREVCVAGDFNNWSPMSHALSPGEVPGVVELTVPLPPGRHSYRLVVDGRWSADPFNPQTQINPYGEPNSLVVVPSEGPRLIHGHVNVEIAQGARERAL